MNGDHRGRSVETERAARPDRSDGEWEGEWVEVRERLGGNDQRRLAKVLKSGSDLLAMFT